MTKNAKKIKSIFTKSSTSPTPVQTPATATAPAASAKPSRQNKSNRVLLEFIKPEAKEVFVAGSFNDWKPEQTPLVPAENGRWIGNLAVSPGRHEYLFVVDGQWLPDPNAPELVPNPFGGKNSVLIVSE
jgi:1,4-alpha-glucan branching enzyme